MSIRASTLIVVLLSIAGPVVAEPNIIVGDYAILPDQAGQEIILSVTGDAVVTGFNLRAQIGDGLGPQKEPVFQDVSFAGGIWDALPYSVMGGPVGGAEQFAQASVIFNAPDHNVISSGTLIKLLIDTTGISGGVYDLNLAGTDIGVDSAFLAIGGTEIPAAITNGSLSVLVAPVATLVMQEPKADPNGVFTGNEGIGVVRFLWSEAIAFSQSDVNIMNEDGNSVPFIIDGNDTELMSVTFGESLAYDRYTITIHDSVTSVATGVAIDGDGDGLSGGDAVIVMEHRLREDHTGDNHVDFFDLATLADKWLWSPL